MKYIDVCILFNNFFFLERSIFYFFSTKKYNIYILLTLVCVCGKKKIIEKKNLNLVYKWKSKLQVSFHIVKCTTFLSG